MKKLTRKKMIKILEEDVESSEEILKRLEREVRWHRISIGTVKLYLKELRAGRGKITIGGIESSAK